MTNSRTDIIEYLKLTLTEKRFKHILGVEETALKLVDIYAPNLDKNKMMLIALLHDISKEQVDVWHEEQLKKLNVDYSQIPNPAYHAFTAHILYQQIFNIQDVQIYNAIKNHTLFATNQDEYAKILFVADFTEQHTRTHKESKILYSQFGILTLDELVIHKLKYEKDYFETQTNNDTSHINTLISFYS